ncbi:hypothetical protein QVD17_34915 [Tagetes erecta]|uniref:Uncharacterized protein n=1 Tax=Tagetes erecta TaxID=13708 RepID=A0AAD8NLG5_TARER|nr:hypothetical protein QVD17_34915 [Tagetes erecta]
MVGYRKFSPKAFVKVISLKKYSPPIVVPIVVVLRSIATDKAERERCGQLVAWLRAVHHVLVVHANQWFLGLVVGLLVLRIVVFLPFL